MSLKFSFKVVKLLVKLFDVLRLPSYKTGMTFNDYHIDFVALANIKKYMSISCMAYDVKFSLMS